MTVITLRDDQAALKSGIYEGWNAGKKNMLGILPTGGGKSIVASDIVVDFDAMTMPGAVIAHRNELVSQMAMHVARRGIFHRIVGPDAAIKHIINLQRKELGRSFVNPDARISVCGIDTIVSRQAQLKAWAMQQKFWINDESHHVLAANKWGTGLGLFTNALGLGITASPSRADGQGLGRHHDGLFDDMVVGLNMRQLIEIGALTDYELVLAESDLEIEDEDIDSPSKLKAAADRSHIVGDVVTEYIKHALGKRAIVFATDVENANKIAASFMAHGIAAASVSAKSSTDYRNEMVERFKDGRLRVLVNVDLFGEGFDVPACEVVIMARPTGSLAVYLQQFGRALRTMFGKTHGIIIDLVGNWKRHGFPDRPHFWTLDRRTKRAKNMRDPFDLTACPGCGKPHELFHAQCPYCGWKPDPAAPGEVRTLEQVDGNLILLDRETLAQMREATILESPGDVGQRVASQIGDALAQGTIKKQIAKIAAQNELREAIAQWAGIQRALGHDDERSHKWFYIKTGVSVLGALAKTNTREQYEKMTAEVKGWYQYA